ncbi:fibronectin type III domain-containing protein [Plantactinospora sp. CA-294935]|uniref:fibronectin type III domain-containing protein n=1 Tax=Plantactinospora sp. CA-294935 TaxID=3240012 RepID=UPI003D8A6B2D
MRSRPSRPARCWARTLILPFLVVALVVTGGTAYAAAEDTEPPSAPGPITVAGTTANSVKLTWAASTDDVGVVEYHVSQIFTDIAMLHRTPTNSIVISGMLPSRTYTFGVWALDAAGNRSAAPPSLRFTMPPGDGQPPTPPVALTVGAVGETTVDLRWGPSTDNVLLAQYEVLSFTLTGNTVVGRVYLMPPAYPRTSTTISGLTPRTTYRLAVRAVDEAGNPSALSNTVTVTTGPAPTCTAYHYRRGPETWISVRNTAPTTVDGWTLSWGLPDSQRIAAIWNASLVSHTGGIVTARNLGWNAVIAPGVAVTIGYLGGGAFLPSGIALNGQPCQVG